MTRSAASLIQALFAIVVLLLLPARAEEKALVPPPSLEQIAENVWIHKSYAVIKPWGRVLSQGMVVKTQGGVYLVDTAWHDADTEKLLDLVVEATGQVPAAAIVTHAHDDKMGGVGALNARGIKTIMHQWSHNDAPSRNLARSTVEGSITLFEGGQPGSAVAIANGELVIQYPGVGHTRDNIVVYAPGANTLFGGCFLRHALTSSPGNTADGDVNAWAASVRRVVEAFPDPEIVIPSHGPAGGPELLTHTIAIAEKAASAP